jgi:hypothetical protein
MTETWLVYIYNGVVFLAYPMTVSRLNNVKGFIKDGEFLDYLSDC